MSSDDMDDPPPEVDFTGGVRGKYAARYPKGPHAPVPPPDRASFHGSACEVINYLEASISAEEHDKRSEAFRCLDEAEAWVKKAREHLTAKG